MVKMRKRSRIQITAKAFSDYNGIEYAADLKKHGLTLAEYYALREVLGTFASCDPNAKEETFLKDVADWMQKRGFTVTKGVVNYRITY